MSYITKGLSIGPLMVLRREYIEEEKRKAAENELKRLAGEPVPPPQPPPVLTPPQGGIILPNNIELHCARKQAEEEVHKRIIEEIEKETPIITEERVKEKARELLGLEKRPELIPTEAIMVGGGLLLLMLVL